MKFFTPDLLGRFASTDGTVANAASEEWEQIHNAYVEHLRAIRPRLPHTVHSLLRLYCLHDAKLYTMAWDERPYCSFFLEVNNPSGVEERFIELKYRLVTPPELIRHQPVPNDGRPFTWWLYDELDLVKGMLFVFSHSILFSGGFELKLVFTSLRLSRLRWCSPPSENFTEKMIDELTALSA